MTTRSKTGSATPGTVEGTVGPDEVPASVRALSTLPDLDYADLFTLATGAEATPEQWARAMFGDVPDAGERLIWHGLLRLRLSQGPSPDTVAGWRVTGRGADWIRLQAASRFVTCDLVVRTAGGRVSLATFVYYDRSFGRLLWTPMSAVHRRLAPGLLREAQTKIEAPAAPPPVDGQGAGVTPGGRSGPSC